jgi:hypothetical protein
MKYKNLLCYALFFLLINNCGSESKAKKELWANLQKAEDILIVKNFEKLEKANKDRDFVSIFILTNALDQNWNINTFTKVFEFIQIASEKRPVDAMKAIDEYMASPEFKASNKIIFEMLKNYVKNMNSEDLGVLLILIVQANYGVGKHSDIFSNALCAIINKIFSKKEELTNQ